MLNALTIDVEEYFHAENLRPAFPRERWDELESRVDEPTGRLLELLRREGVRATFFVLGWLAERRPHLVRQIVADGHEVACHGYGHELLTRLGPESFRGDLRRALSVLTPLLPRRPRGYRAPCFTIMPTTWWALGVLAEEGFEYDSSVFPIAHDRYGDPDAPTGLYEVRSGEGRRIVEAPPATVRALGRNWPIAGGGWLRLLPWRVTSAGIETRNARGEPAVVYLHPWELDAGQPPAPGVSWRRRLRHSIGTRRTFAKLERLIGRHRFGTVEAVLSQAGLLESAPDVRAKEPERRAA